MAQNNWLDSFRAGLEANIPAVTWAVGTVFSNNQTPGTPSTGVNEASSYPGNISAGYLATDDNVLHTWNPATQKWADSPGAVGTVVIAAAGQTQGTATPISKLARAVIVSAMVTATHNGVVLPVSPVTGLEVRIANASAGGIKVYPGLHNFINAGASNAADTTTIAINKVNVYIAVSNTKWVTQRGA